MSFSPDGAEFVFSRFKPEANESSIVRVRADGSDERVVLSSKTEILAYPAWSPNGGSIAFARYFIPSLPKDRYVSIETVSSDGGDSAILLTEKLDNCYRIAWTSGGEGLVFAGTKLGEAMSARRDQIWFASLRSGRITRLSPEGSRYVFGGLTDEGVAVAGSVSRTSQIWALDSNGDSRTAVQLTRGTTDGRSGLVTLPDGRIGYLMRNGDTWEIWTMNADGSDPTMIFNELAAVEELRATPDGKYFVFSAKVGVNINLYRINTDGGELKVLLESPEGEVMDPAPSADSRWVVFSLSSVDKDGIASVRLRRVSIDGGETNEITEAGIGGLGAHFSPDGRYISFAEVDSLQPRLSLLSPDTGRIVRSFDLGPSSLLNVGGVWSPDGNELAYVVYQNKTSNVWLQPIDGSPKRQLTDFTSGHIYRIAYSADGKRLYLARGYAKNEALMIKGFAE